MLLKCSTSLWSADLTDLAAEIRRVEPYSERFHIDVADGQYVNTLLFFPDLVAAIRGRTRLPLDVHLITRNPLSWVERFVQAGADSITFYPDAAPDPRAVIDAIRAAGKEAGISLRVEDAVDAAVPYLEKLDRLTVMGTAMGIKGVDMDPCVPGKIRQARGIIDARGLHTQIEADGGIRWSTVPLIHEAGADYIVPGSLMFNEDPVRLRAFLAGLDRPY